MRFEAKIRKVGAWYVVDVPAALSQAMGKRGHVPIVGRVNGIEIRQSMLPVNKGKHSLVLRKALRERLGVVAGDRVKVTFELDEAPPVEPIPPDLAMALREEGVFDAFESLPRSYRNGLLKEIEGAATETTREKRVAKAVVAALARREKGVDRGKVRDAD